MNTLSCLMITTTVRERYRLQRPTVMSIEAANDKGQLTEKIMSVDVVAGHSFEPEWFAQYEQLGWKVVYGPCTVHRGMANNMERGLQHVTGDMLFYCEDDVLIQRIPDHRCLRAWFVDEDMGALVYNTHVLAPWTTEQSVVDERIKYINTPSNYYVFNPFRDEDMYLRKDERILYDEYWICFPACIMPVELFMNCLLHAGLFCKGKGMEPGMSEAWFRLNYNQKFTTAMYVQPEIQTKIGTLTFQDVYDLAQMRFWNNDETLRHPSWNDRKNTIF